MLLRIWISFRLYFSLVFIWAVFVFPIWSQGLSSSAPQSSVLYPYLTPFARYEDLDIPLGYFLSYEAPKLKNLRKLDLAQRKQVIQRALEQMIFEHRMSKMAAEEHIEETSDYIFFNNDMESERLTSLFEFKNFQIPFQITQADAGKKYAELKGTEFKLLPEFTFRQIFTQTIDKNETQKLQSRQKIEAAQAALRSGSDFVKVASDFSESQKKEAVLGPFIPREYSSEKIINPTLENVILKMQVGEISPILETHYGFHILKLESFSPLAYAPLKDVLPTVIARLRKERLEIWRKEMQELHWKEAVTLYQPEKMLDPHCFADSALAIVYGETVTLEQFRMLLGSGFIQNKNQSEQEYHDHLNRQFEQIVVYRRIVAKLAREQNYTKIPAWRYATQERRTRRVFNLCWGKITGEYKRDHPVTLEEKREYYEKYPKRALEPLQVHAAEMTFTIAASDSKDRYAKIKSVRLAREKAQEALGRVLRGEPFDEVAADMSESDSASQGGDIGIVMINDSKLPFPVVDQLLKMESGSISNQLIETDKAFYLVKCLEKPECVPMSFDDPRTQKRLEDLILNSRILELKQTYFQQLVKPEKITMLFDAVDSLDPKQADAPSLQVPHE